MSSSISRPLLEQKALTYHLHSSQNYTFMVLESLSPYFSTVEKAIRKTLEPLYGNQDRSIEKIKAQADRITEVLLYDGQPAGFIVYKKARQNEFANFGIKDSFELKTFFVIDNEKNAENKYDLILLSRVTEVAKSIFAKSIHLTAPEEYDAEFFRSHGFAIAKTWKDKYVPGVTEHLFYLNISPKKEKSPEKLAQTRKRCGEEKKEERPDSKKRIKGPKLPAKGISRISDYFKSPLAALSTKRVLHQFTMKKTFIHQIRKGRKTIEGRINSGRVLKIRPGDQIRFYYMRDAQDDVRCNITDVTKYSSFREMLQREGVEKCLPEVRGGIGDAVELYDKIPGYAEKSAKFGVVAIHLSNA